VKTKESADLCQIPHLLLLAVLPGFWEPSRLTIALLSCSWSKLRGTTPLKWHLSHSRVCSFLVTAPCNPQPLPTPTAPNIPPASKLPPFSAPAWTSFPPQHFLRFSLLLSIPYVHCGASRKEGKGLVRNSALGYKTPDEPIGVLRS